MRGDEVDDNSDYEEEENESQEERELEESAEDHKREMMEVSIDARSRRMQGQQLTEQQIELLSTEQRASIEKLRRRALEHGEEPKFHISVDFDVTKAEEAITNEQERLIKRKEFQQRKLAGACVTEAETNANDRAELRERKEKRVFPPTAMVWTTIQKAQMSDIFLEATGALPEEEEEEFLCRAETRKFNLWDDGKTGDKVEVSQVEGECTMYRPEHHDMQSCRERDTRWQRGEFRRRGQEENKSEHTVWQQGTQRHDLIFHDEEEFLNEERRLWRGQASRGRWSNVVQGETRGTGEVCRVDMKPDSQTQFRKNVEDNRMKWLEVRTEVIKITQERLKQLSPTGDCQLSEDQQSYIEALTDPQVTVVVCQGGAGTGKTYTAMLVACIAVQAGLLANVKQTKPLVSTGGVGLGYERGEMADKLKYCMRCNSMVSNPRIE